MSKIDSLEALLEDNLKDLYSAEKQLTKALPKMAKAASSPELRQAIEDHLEETEEQIERLDKIASIMDIKLNGKKCKAMEGLIEEGSEVMDSDGDENLLDAAMIVAAQKIEHYEISGYGSARALAERLGLTDVVELLDESLDEESAADEKLTAITQDTVLANFGIEGSEGTEASL